MKKYFTFLFLLLTTISYGQITISGNVVNIKTNEAIAGANVFISNTSYKTITNSQGKFAFVNLNIQKGELIVNALGYKYEVINIDSKTKSPITIVLELQVKELDVVLVQSYEKDGYKKWGKLFTEGFIGTTKEAEDCTIENTSALKFYYNKKTGDLAVSANEPLKIVNKALGYTIDYTMEDYVYNTKSNVLFYSGYPVFTQMQKGKRKMRRWEANRNTCYKGSVMHFMRSLYRNKIAQEGFIVQKANKILNEKKAAYKKTLKKSIENNSNGVVTIITPSNHQDHDIINQPDSIYEIISQVLPADSFAFAIDSTTAGMYFEKHLIISYKKQDIKTTVSSFVKLLLPEELHIYQNGYYYNAINFLSERYWAETEKMSTMLPYDFVYKKEN